MTEQTPQDPDPVEDVSPDEAGPELEPGEDVDEFAGEYTAPPLIEEAASSEATSVGFYDAGPDVHALDDLMLVGRPGVLERLGPAHFRSKGFSFMGFLQTVYDHVAGEVQKDQQV